MMRHDPLCLCGGGHCAQERPLGPPAHIEELERELTQELKSQRVRVPAAAAVKDGTCLCCRREGLPLVDTLEAFCAKCLDWECPPDECWLGLAGADVACMCDSECVGMAMCGHPCCS